MSANQAGAFAIMAGMAGAMAACGVAWYIIQVIAYWRIFKKAGRPGWHSIIPILNMYDQYDMSWNGMMGILVIVCGCLASVLSTMARNNSSGVLSILTIVLVLVAIVIGIIGQHKLSRAFGHGIGFTLGLIFLEPIFMLILGFGSSTYQGRQ